MDGRGFGAKRGGDGGLSSGLLGEARFGVRGEFGGGKLQRSEVSTGKKDERTGHTSLLQSAHDSFELMFFPFALAMAKIPCRGAGGGVS